MTNWCSAIGGMRANSGLQALTAAIRFCPKSGLRSDIQPRMEACGECASFPHTNQARGRFDDTKLMSANGGI
jgi:hypothetical protein